MAIKEYLLNYFFLYDDKIACRKKTVNIKRKLQESFFMRNFLMIISLPIFFTSNIFWLSYLRKTKNFRIFSEKSGANPKFLVKSTFFCLIIASYKYTKLLTILSVDFGQYFPKKTIPNQIKTFFWFLAAIVNKRSFICLSIGPNWSILVFYFIFMTIEQGIIA